MHVVSTWTALKKHQAFCSRPGQRRQAVSLQRLHTCFCVFAYVSYNTLCICDFHSCSLWCGVEVDNGHIRFTSHIIRVFASPHVKVLTGVCGFDGSKVSQALSHSLLTLVQQQTMVEVVAVGVEHAAPRRQAGEAAGEERLARP